MDSSTTDAGGDGGACMVAPQTQSPACDACITAMCDMAWCACASDTMVNDAGVPGCIQYSQCVVDCIAGNPDAGIDGGSPTTCFSDCAGGDAGGTYTMAEQMAGQAFLTCIGTMCTMAADGGPGACTQ